MRSWFKGKKTYILSAVALIGVVANFLTGEISAADAIQQLPALALSLTPASLRAGFSSLVK